MRRILNASASALAMQWEAEKSPPKPRLEAGDIFTIEGSPGDVLRVEYTHPKTKKPMVAMDFETRGLNSIFNTSESSYNPAEISDRRFFVYDEAIDTPQSAWDHFRNGGGVGFELRDYQKIGIDWAMRGGDRTTVWPPIGDSMAPPRNMAEFRNLYLGDFTHLTPTGRTPPPPPAMIFDFPPNVGKSPMNETYRKIRDLILDNAVVIPKKGD